MIDQYSIGTFHTFCHHDPCDTTYLVYACNMRDYVAAEIGKRVYFVTAVVHMLCRWNGYIYLGSSTAI